MSSEAKLAVSFLAIVFLVLATLFTLAVQGLDKRNEEIKQAAKECEFKGGVYVDNMRQAGKYTNHSYMCMRKSLFESIKSRAVQGTKAGQWSARKAQLLAKQYKAKGGGYK